VGIASDVANEYVLADSEKQHVADLAARAAKHLKDGASALAPYLMDMPAELRRRLVDFARDSSSGFFLVRGMPVGDLPPTPSVHSGTVLVDHPTTGSLLLVAELLGALIGYAEEKKGDLVHEVHPVRGEEKRIENSGSVAFDFHTENVHHPLRPDFLGLLCLRQDHAGVAATRVASVREAAPHLTPAQIEVLRRPEFRSFYPTSFTRGSTGERPMCAPHPVLFGPDDRLFLRYNSHNTQAGDDEGRAALRALAEALEKVSHDIVLAPGELVVVDNHIAAHGRSAFVARYDGSDRWLRRFYSARSVPRWAESMMPAPRVLPSLAQIRGVL
jgi:L-asparagine oxygenase